MNDKNDKEKYRKVYVDTVTVMRKDGVVMPRMIVWEDGEKFDIQRVVHIEPCASTKVGGRGMRYTVKIEGKIRYIFREEDKWFVEAENKWYS